MAKITINVDSEEELSPDFFINLLNPSFYFFVGGASTDTPTGYFFLFPGADHH